eukprot:179145-Pelagomonas_calceolata.AAC.1
MLGGEALGVAWSLLLTKNKSTHSRGVQKSLGILLLCCCNLLICHATQREQWQAQATAAAQAYEDYLAW